MQRFSHLIGPFVPKVELANRKLFYYENPVSLHRDLKETATFPPEAVCVLSYDLFGR